jgi:hypothetical protein
MYTSYTGAAGILLHGKFTLRKLKSYLFWSSFSTDPHCNINVCQLNVWSRSNRICGVIYYKHNVVHGTNSNNISNYSGKGHLLYI